MSKEKNEPKAGIKSTLRYLGPSLPVLQNNTTFIDGKVPNGILLLIERCPAIKQLLVKECDVAKTYASLQNPHSSESLFKRKIQEFLKGGIENV